MELETLTENVEIIQTLGTYPNQEDGLTPEELKEKFDTGSRVIKEFINNKVVPVVNENTTASEKSKQDISALITED